MLIEDCIACNCGTATALYICTSTACANHKQQVFCNKCLLKGLHTHFPVVTIHDATANIEENWKSVTQNVTATYNQIKA